MIEVNMPKSFKSLSSLERWMKDFMFNPLDIRINANDRSIATSGESIYDRYDRLKALFLGNVASDVNDTIDYDDIDADTSIYENAIDDLKDRSNNDWDDMMLKIRESERSGYLIMIYTEGIEDNYMNMPKIKDYTPDMLDYIEEKYQKISNLPIEIRNIANMNAQTILGANNDNLYILLKSYLEMKKPKIDSDIIIENNSSANELFNFDKYMKNADYPTRELSHYYIKEEMNSMEDKGDKYVSLLYSLNALERLKIEQSQTMPYFTPNEMEKFGVFSGEINLYSDKPDNTNFTKDMTVKEWFEEYKNSYKKNKNVIKVYEWNDLLTKLYADYEKIIETDDLDKINARKQSILELGWNPEICFNKNNNVFIRHYKESLDLSPFIKNIISENENISNEEIIIHLNAIQERVRGVDYKDGVFVIKTLEDVNSEFFKCNRNLKSFEKAKDYESMKDELCKLKYLDNFAVRRMKNRHHKRYKEYADAHARITNVFNKYLTMVIEHDPDFVFSQYYKESEWYDEEVRVSESLLRKLISLLMSILRRSKS